MAVVAAWFDGDPEGRRRLDGYWERGRWWDLLRTPNRHGWLAVEDGRPVGFVDVEIDGADALVAAYVRPENRGRGTGRQVLGALAELAGATLGVDRLVGASEPDNEASLRCCRAAGFVAAGTDRDGNLLLVLSLR